MRNRGYLRKVAVKKALRKKRISEEVYPDGVEYPYYANLHQYSKNKIHCSCWLCSAKTKTRNGYNYSIPDLKKVESMEAMYNEYLQTV